VRLHEGIDGKTTGILELLKRMEHSELTVHGFRSTFRDRAAERTNFPTEIAEAALTHISADKVEPPICAAPSSRNARLMNEWAKFCSEPRRMAAAVSINGDSVAAVN